MTGRIGRAFEMAFAAHRGQTDKAGAPYIAHVVRVAAGVGDDAQAQIVALLHDIVEDTSVTLDEVSAAMGVDIATAVDAISRRKGEAPDDYFARVCANPLARIVKRADLADNSDPARLSLLSAPDRARLEAKYDRAKSMLQDPV